MLFNFAMFLFWLTSLIPQNRENNSEKVFFKHSFDRNYTENSETKVSMNYQKCKYRENKCIHSIQNHKLVTVMT